MDIEMGLGFVLLVTNLFVLLKIERYIEKRMRGLNNFFESYFNAKYRTLSTFKKKLYGEIEQVKIKVKVSEKLSDRAFSLASSANLGLMAVQRTLVVRPAYASKKQMIKNELAQQQVTEAIVGIKKPEDIDYSEVDWMYAALDDDERELVDRAREMAEAKKIDI